MITLWAAFLTGLLGSLHCVGMCGPICLALPVGHGGSRWWRLLQYNLGRVFTYVSLGLVFGLLGAGLRIAGLQATLSVIAGVCMIILALLAIDIDSRLAQWLPLHRLHTWVQQRLGNLLRHGADGGWWQLGMLNGLLPCGLVYLAMAGALTMGQVGWSAAYMLAFGLGTLPLMWGTALAGQFLPATWRRSLRRLYPIFTVGLGLWLIYRGLQFHLPPNFQFLQALDGAPMCH